MQKFLLFLLCLITFCQLPVFAFSNEKEMLKDLTAIEEQILDKTYKKDKIPKRLERLEIAVYGTIQDGCEYIRIKKIKRDVTNISSGGNGLGDNNKVFDLAGNSIGNYNWSIGRYYDNIYHGMERHSHRIPACYGHHPSHRLPPPPPGNSYNYNPLGLGNGIKSYSLNSNIKILDD